MNLRGIADAIALAVVVLSCWIGSVGMWRMREPMQALHYLAVPACIGSAALTVAVFLRTGNTQSSWKMVLIAFVLLAINSVVTHATARAFRTRDLGHWQPQPGEDVERMHASEPNS